MAGNIPTGGKSKAKPANKAKVASGAPLKASSKPKVDPITLSVIRGILETTQREMTLSLEKRALQRL
jgi:hypothetical protein